ncbi:MAG TPA: AAA family ATPase [Syntrophorhabdales bacterium]|nr:AAA family ATPase [Syntrophorhabdales bacterium]
MYYEYWGLKKPPFDNVPDPSMYVESHASVENTIAETLFAIEEGNECIAVIVGDVGLGKTLSLRLILDNLSQEKYKVAFITNPDMSFVQLMREIVGQLTGQPCEIQKRIDLLEMFNKIIFQTADEGKKVLLFIDEANALPPGNLESLRLLTNMQEDHRNLFTIVLAGQIELARRLENPRRANLFQRIGTYCRIDKIQSPELIKDYVETRLRLAGCERKIFTDDAIDVLWEYSDHGVPRLINKICKLCLKAGETNEFEQIDGPTAKQIAERFQKLTGPALQKRKPRKRLSPSATRESGDFKQDEEQRRDEEIPQGVVLNPPDVPSEVGLGFVASNAPLEEVPAETAPLAEAEPPQAAEPDTGALREQISKPDSEDARTDLYEEATLGKFKIKVGIPLQLLKMATSSTRENRAKLAGSLAAQTLDKYPQLTSETAVDPVALWSEIRSLILNAFEREIAQAEADQVASAV